MIVGKKAAGSKAKPMFVHFVLEPLWRVYEAALQGNEGQEMLEKVIKSMNLTIPPRDLQHKDLKVVRQAVMSRLLPLSDTVLSMVIDCLPDPILAQSDRISSLLPKHEVLIDVNNDALVELDHVRRAVGACDSTASAPCVALVSKMFAVPISVLPLKGPGGDLTSNFVEELGVGEIDAVHQECFLAFTRVFSGMLFMAIEPSDPADMGALMRGLRLLNRADPLVEVSISGIGEQVLATAGEVHLERCIKDLKERFAGVELEVSPPIVSYRETIEAESVAVVCPQG
eukprot:Gb_06669 [translate_table: standard]